MAGRQHPSVPSFSLHMGMGGPRKWVGQQALKIHLSGRQQHHAFVHNNKWSAAAVIPMRRAGPRRESTRTARPDRSRTGRPRAHALSFGFVFGPDREEHQLHIEMIMGKNLLDITYLNSYS